MSSYRKYKETIITTNKARREAVKLLITEHQAEFDRLYSQQAIMLGLNPTKVSSRITRREDFNARVGETNAD